MRHTDALNHRSGLFLGYSETSVTGCKSVIDFFLLGIANVHAGVESIYAFTKLLYVF